MLLLFCLSVSIIFIRRENLVVPLVVAMCFLPADISIKVATLDFYALRIVAIIGLLKVLFSEQHEPIKTNTIDYLFIGYNVLGSVIYIIASQNFTGAVINRSGVLVDTVILYIVLRNSVQSKESIHVLIKTFVVCILLLLPFVIFEFFSARNLFSILGRDSIAIRNGEIRVACTFSHSILFGSFAAALLPVMWAQYKISKSNAALLCALCCLFYVYASSSSGPVIVAAAAIFFLLFFPWKHYSSTLAWFMAGAVLFIHFVRESPFWHFIYVRITVNPSSTGYHRYMLVNAAIKEFSEWWLLGYGDSGPRWHIDYWPYTHATFTDVTNHYLLEGVRGGIFTMILLIALCIKSMQALARHSLAQEDLNEQWLWWGFTVMMICHCITFLSVAYFGQITMLYTLTVALAAYAYHKQRTDTVDESVV